MIDNPGEVCDGLYAISWSGGKDCTLSLDRCIRRWNKSPACLLTMMIEDGSRSRSHGLRKEILETQAASLNIPILFFPCSWADYEEKFANALKGIYAMGITTMVFGDICIPDDPNWSAHNAWADGMCRRAGFKCIQPLWGDTSDNLQAEFFSRQYKALLVALRKDLICKSNLGQLMTPSLIGEFVKKGIDACGERGEFHTVAIDGPLFTRPLSLSYDKSSISERYNYWHVDLQTKC